MAQARAGDPRGEMLERCDARGRPLGPVPRERCHGDPSIIHLVVHLHVVDAAGRLLLQRRGATKDLYPGRWDTAVGGHVGAGETPAHALLREAREELGIDARAAVPIHSYLHSNEHEAEFVHAFRLASDGPFAANPAEVDEVRFFSAPEIRGLLGTGELTPNLEAEWARLTESGALGSGGSPGAA